MKSSTGQYFVGLDHLRALAAFLVFTWHFYHVDGGHNASPLAFPLSLMTEGHVGVALFMCLSGYLFAKLLDGKQVRYLPFLWNRAIRLFPLLFAVILFKYGSAWLATDTPLGVYVWQFLQGFVLPVWPNGGWSITVELHFYVILPLLLMLALRGSLWLLAVIAASLLFRLSFWLAEGQVQSLAYWTIIGCIDYFVFGIIAFELRRVVTGRHLWAAIALGTLLAFVYLFDSLGGFYQNGGYPTPSGIWVIYPTVVGALTSLSIAWYDQSFAFRDHGLSGLLAQIGACSYSIYLLHFFVVFQAAAFIDARLISLSNDYVALAVSAVAFLAFVPFAQVCFRAIELPPLRYRLPYTVKAAGQGG